MTIYFDGQEAAAQSASYENPTFYCATNPYGTKPSVTITSVSCGKILDSFTIEKPYFDEIKAANQLENYVNFIRQVNISDNVTGLRLKKIGRSLLTQLNNELLFSKEVQDFLKNPETLIGSVDPALINFYTENELSVLKALIAKLKALATQATYEKNLVIYWKPDLGLPLQPANSYTLQVHNNQWQPTDGQEKIQLSLANFPKKLSDIHIRVVDANKIIDVSQAPENLFFLALAENKPDSLLYFVAQKNGNKFLSPADETIQAKIKEYIHSIEAEKITALVKKYSEEQRFNAVKFEMVDENDLDISKLDSTTQYVLRTSTTDDPKLLMLIERDENEKVSKTLFPTGLDLTGFSQDLKKLPNPSPKENATDTISVSLDEYEASSPHAVPKHFKIFMQNFAKQQIEMLMKNTVLIFDDKKNKDTLNKDLIAVRSELQMKINALTDIKKFQPHKEQLLNSRKQGYFGINFQNDVTTNSQISIIETSNNSMLRFLSMLFQFFAEAHEAFVGLQELKIKEQENAVKTLSRAIVSSRSVAGSVAPSTHCEDNRSTSTVNRPREPEKVLRSYLCVKAFLIFKTLLEGIKIRSVTEEAEKDTLPILYKLMFNIVIASHSKADQIQSILEKAKENNPQLTEIGRALGVNGYMICKTKYNIDDHKKFCKHLFTNHGVFHNYLPKPQPELVKTLDFIN